MSTTTSYEFVKEWFERVQESALSKGMSDSAALWRDGLEHLENMKSQRDSLLEALKDMLDGLANINGDWTVSLNFSVDKAIEAIKKAEGK